MTDIESLFKEESKERIEKKRREKLKMIARLIKDYLSNEISDPMLYHRSLLKCYIDIFEYLLKKG